MGSDRQPSMNIRIAANMAELRANLAEGKTMIEALGPSVQKMAATWSQHSATLITNAHAITAAVQQVGAGTLTAADAAKNLKVLDAAMAQLKSTGQSIPPLMQETADTLRGAGKAADDHGISFGKLVASYVSAQAIIGAVKGAFHALVGGIEESIKAAGDAEKAHVQMVAALRAQGTAVPSVITAYQGYADALQQTTIYQDDAIEGAEALLVQVGNVMPRDMQKALEATTNLASGLGKDLTSATMLVAKAAEGNYAALKKGGVVIDEVKAKQEGFGYVLDQINAKFAGQAAAIAGTYQGRLAQLGNTWNNVEESVGRAITTNATVLSVMDQVNKAIIGNTSELNKNSAVNNIVSGAVIAVAKAFSYVLEAVDLVQTAYQGVLVTSNTVIAAFLNIGIAVLDTATALGTYTKYVNPVAWTSTWKNGMQEIADSSTYLKGAVQGLTDHSLAAIDSSVKWGNEIQGLRSGINTFTTNLEATRGKTVELATATDTSTGAWNRNTKAVTDNKEAQAKAKAEAEKFAQSEAEINSAGSSWVGTLNRINSAVVDWSIHLLQADVSLEKVRTNQGLTETESKAIENQFKFLAATTTATSKAFDTHGQILGALRPHYSNAHEYITGLTDDQTALSATVYDFGIMAAPSTVDALKQMGMTTEQLRKLLHDLRLEAKTAGDIMQTAFGDAAMILDNLPGKFAQVGAAVARTGQAIMTNLASGNVWGAVIAGAVGAIQVIKQLFGGPSKEELAARETWASFQKQFGTLQQAIEGVGAAYAKVGLTGADAQRDLQRALDATHVSAAAEASALATINLVLDQAKQKAAAFAAATQGMASTGAANFNAVAIALKGDQASLDAVGAQAVTTYAVLVAGGLSTSAALAAVKPGLESLRQSYIDLGIKIEDTGLASLLMQSRMLDANPAVMAGIDGLAASTKQLDDLGLMNADTFGKMQVSGESMYTRLQAAAAANGGTTKDALLPMQGWLHTAAEEAEKLGIPLSANTKLLMDQSKELGIWKDKGKSAADLMLDGMDKLVASVKELIDQLKGIPSPSFTVTQHNQTVTDPLQGGNGVVFGGAQKAGGDFATSGHVEQLHEHEECV